MGDAIGIFNIGTCYKEGFAVKKDEKKAFEYFKNSAKIGHADGMYFIGEFYRKGIVVKKNIDIAFEWHLKSAITEQNTTIEKKGIFSLDTYDKFENIEMIGKGAFSTVFKTI
ncbi:HCP-like protein [Gigaspora margarita]|uniref:HCP-like protein n=1 Tax=Gigaspora margarita TaxID=4874 RepID=A0A8H4B1Q2_GIGMA|nr:HCP-like protein [Gigaspora margarita]